MACCGGMSSTSRPPRGIREETLLRVPGASVHLLDGAEGPVELARGDLAVVRIAKDGVAVATVARVGRDLGWPLTRDEPVVRLDRLHYLFTLPDRDGGAFLNYGVSFAAPNDALLASLDAFLRANACFSTPSAGAPAPSRSYTATATATNTPPATTDGYWNDYAPRMEGYNNVLAKAIAAGTGQLVRGIFMCSDAYASQVQRGADLVRLQAAGSVSKRVGGAGGGPGRTGQADAKRGVNKSLKRVRKLSEMTEKMSQSLLDTVIAVTGSMAAPLLRSKQGKAFLATVPGEVILASLDAINKVMDAVEAAERRSLAATSNVVAGAVSRRYGESAGEATEDAFATAGHAVGTAWNLFKIRKAVTPSSSLPGNMVKSAVRNRK
ncbi:senescence/dehydration-associated protein At4g35985, chloroplastic-like isoform X2 [Oryza brachyantha]|uniref:senescence/dehydration-associated protein At4g35985, chloroplastic-like isoform X2 n=1 Tax=Oryza brachyantha TaxID=4533 RepID=UPI0003EABD65|nr:senescence/dehydration-associated protein At4g35985, chloroplastic-like isoform X2 [Oryza brachyantha]